MTNVDSSETPASVESNLNTGPVVEEAKTTRRKTDLARGYFTQYTEGGRKRIKCMYCDMKFLGGGIHRFKEHLAKWPGNVAACQKVDPEVEHTMFQNIEDWNAKKNKAKEQYEDDHPYGPEPIEVEEACRVSTTGSPALACHVVTATRKRGATPAIGKYFKPRTNPRDQPTIKSVLQGEEVTLKTDLCVAR